MVLMQFCNQFALADGKGDTTNADNTIMTIKQGEHVVLHASVTNAVAYQWFKDNIAISGAYTDNFTVTEQGIYTVIAYNKSSCASPISDKMVVVVLDAATQAQVDMAINKIAETKQVAKGGQFYYLLRVENKGETTATGIQVKDALPRDLEYIAIKSTSAGAANYNNENHTVTWQIGTMEGKTVQEMQIEVKALVDGLIKNTATVSSKEQDSNLADNTSTSLKNVLGLSVPNVFTPNGDGVNDVFEIAGLSKYPDNEITIFNRWGNSVYHKKGYLSDWTGNGLNEGTYFYVLQVNDSGNSETYKGYVTLLRSNKSN
jgi:gliding motility-associated-like protein/uncharacterized repeat protein (TIGR01451 family)